MKFSISNAFLVMRKEYVKWLMNPRHIMLLLIFIPTREMIINPMIEVSNEMGQPLNVFESAIATTNSGIIIIILTTVYMVLISSFPTMDGNVLFYMKRMGKRSWIIGEIMFQCLSALTYTIVVYMVSILQTAGISFISNGWSIAVTDHDKLYGDMSVIQMDSIIPPNLYNQMSPYKALFMSFSLLCMFLIICSMFFTVGCMYSRKLLFFCLMIVQIALGGALYILSGSRAMWYFVICHAFLSSHYSMYFRKYLFSPWRSYFILAAIIAVLCLIAYRKAGKLNLDALEERRL